jgi:raffinose/stachyose/melibiose transport system substrate-binding protein
MKKKSLVAIVLLVVCAMSLLANSVSEVTTEHEPITIMDAQRDYSALIELVHEKYPEINIEVVPYRGRNMSAYCKQQLETGIMPDIYSTTQAWDSKYQKENLIDLSQYAVTELYNEARLSEYIVDGGVYLLPFDFTITGYLCNKSLLERNDIAIPTSFAQMRDETIPALEQKGIKVAACLLDLPGSAFQFFFDVCAGQYLNLAEGRAWRSSFIDLDSDTWASNNEDLLACVEYFQQWIDCGLMSNSEISGEYSSVIGDFTAGNTAFLIGTVKQFTQYADGTGDQYVLLPWFSEDGDNNTYITSPSRFYGLNKELSEPGNEQKLQDALHVLEVLSSNEGYVALNGESSTNLCSIKEFELTQDSPYSEASKAVNKGYAMNLVYTGWDSYLVPFGEAVLSWINGEITGQEALAVLDSTKQALRETGVTSYATVTEELNTVQAAQLSGQMFMEATGADAALISYNVYNPNIHALMENSYGANGSVLPGELTEEYITIFLPTGWYDTLLTLQRTGKEIKEMAQQGADTRNTGFHYPYVFMTANGQPLNDDDTYTVVICGYNKSEKSTLGLVNTGIVGLDAAKAYLLKVGEVSTKTLDESLVQSIGSVEE